MSIFPSPDQNAHAEPTASPFVETERAERRRWRGTLMMYSPVLPFMIMFSAIGYAFTGNIPPGGTAPPPPWYAMVPLGIGGLGLFLSVPLALVGVVQRAVSAALLYRVCVKHHVASLPASPPIQTGERIGPLVVEAIEDGRAVLRYLPTPRPIWKILGACVTSLFTGLLVAAATQALRSGILAHDIGGCAMLAVFLVFVFSFFGNRTLTLEDHGDLIQATSHFRFPGVPWTLAKNRVVEFDDCPSDVAAHRVRSLLRSTGVSWGVEEGVLMDWKLRRLAATVRGDCGLFIDPL